MDSFIDPGPAKIGRPCRTCNHPDLPRINDQMRQGVTLAKIAERTGIYPQALSRHRRNHLASFQK